MSVVCSGGGVVEVVALKDRVAGIARAKAEAEAEAEKQKKRRSHGFFLDDDDDDDDDGGGGGDDDNGGAEEEEPLESSTSTIGVESSPSSLSSSSAENEEEKEEEEDEVQSKEEKGGLLGSFDSLEESLPIKRGLSNFFSGKSKSFASLSEVATAAAAVSAKDLAKPENPFNKRRRILMACARRASYSSLIITPSLPPLLSPEHTVEEEEEEEENEAEAEAEAEEEEENGKLIPALAPLLSHQLHHHHRQQQQHPQNNHGENGRKKKMTRSFRSPRSFSLSDLQHA